MFSWVLSEPVGGCYSDEPTCVLDLGSVPIYCRVGWGSRLRALASRSWGDLWVAFWASLQNTLIILIFPNFAAEFLPMKYPSCLKGVLKASFWSQVSALLPKIILQDAGKGIACFLRVFSSHSPKNNTKTVNTCTSQRFLANSREINGFHSERTSLTSSMKSGNSGNWLLIQILIIPGFWHSFPSPRLQPETCPHLNWITAFQVFIRHWADYFLTNNF